MSYMATFIEILTYINSMFDLYYGNMCWLLLAAVSSIFLLFKGSKRQKYIVISSIVIYAMIYNPVLYKYVYSEIVFWRLFWLVPTFLLITLGFCELLTLIENSCKRIALTVITIPVLVVFGTNVFNSLAVDSFTGIYKLPRGTEQVGLFMLSLDETPRCIVPRELMTSIRQYSADIEPMYGRNIDGFLRFASDDDRNIYDAISSEVPDYNYIFSLARLNGYNFVINSESKPASEAVLDRYDYELAAVIEGFNIYYNPNITDTLSDDDISMYHNSVGWCLIRPDGVRLTSTYLSLYGYYYYVNHCGYIYEGTASLESQQIGLDDLIITQYGSNYYGQPSMFYTIENTNGTVVFVDGGNPDEADFVMNHIRMYGNHINAWILTHPHTDHIGAFNEIYNNYVLTDGEHVSIDNIYAIDIPSDYYNEIAQPWDDISTFNEFVQLAGTMNNLTYVERGETYDVGRISFEVYNTFTDESYDIPTGSLPNACTMVLEVFTPSGDDGESMLFLGDLEQGNADLIAGLFGDELQADYVQAAHHGQNVDYAFYELIGAHTATVDAPEWLRQENPDSHTAFEHLQWFEANNITVLTYDTTPNVIILHAED